MKIKAIATSIITAVVGVVASRVVQPPGPANMVHHALRAVTLMRNAGPHGMAEGSGFFIADNLVATSYHVIEDMRHIVVETYSGRRFRVHRGLAVLRTPAKPMVGTGAQCPSR